MAPNLHEFLLRLKTLFYKRRMDRDLAEELEFHHAMLRAKLEREGAAPQDADATARRRFGNQGRWHERLRELWQFRTLENLLRDVGYSVRSLRNSPGFTAVALLTLALGVGANTTVFSMIDGLLLRPLDIPQSGDLAVLGIDQGGPRTNYSFSAPMFRGLEHRHEVFEQVIAFDHAEFQLNNGRGNEIVFGQYVSGDFFTALRTPPLLGRTLGREDDRVGGNPKGFGVVIAEGFWERWFNRAPDVVGRKIQIDNTLFTVVGVMPKRFIGADPTQRPQFFVPLAAEPILNGERSMTAAGFHGWWLTVMGRLQPGATLEKANAQLSSVSDAVLRESVPDAQWIADREKRHFHFTAESGSAGFTYLRMNFRKPLVAVFAMCGGILLLACLNLASLLMARGTARQRELATRMAMGATRRRLIQQLLVESLMLGVGGTVAGLAIAPLVSRSLAAILLGQNRDAHLDTSLDIRIFAFAAVAAIGATLLFGLVPAIQATSRNLIDRIKDGLHATQTNERRKILPRILMSVEVALALMLVVGAGLLASSLLRLYNSGEGFDPRGVENIAFSMDKLNLKGDKLVRFYQQMGDGLRRQPGVKTVSFARMIPLSGSQWDEEFSTATTPDQDIYMNTIAPDYFAAMSIPLFAGRDFTWNDAKPENPRIILNQSAARLLSKDGDALGQIVRRHEGEKWFTYQVIGVVGDAKYQDLWTAAPPAAYLPMSVDDEHSPSFNAVVRIEGNATPLAGVTRSLATDLAPGIPTPETTSMMTVVDESLSAERMMTWLSAFFAACALVVTAIGLYGTLAYATARRTSEIGIRMALGAQRAQVVSLVFRQNVAVVALGTAAGLTAALLASRALASFLYGTSTRDPLVVAGSIVALAAIASAASLLPALRAARIEPMAAIRCE
jgi:putative ABC transport system permease protein